MKKYHGRCSNCDRPTFAGRPCPACKVGYGIWTFRRRQDDAGMIIEQKMLIQCLLAGSLPAPTEPTLRLAPPEDAAGKKPKRVRKDRKGRKKRSG